MPDVHDFNNSETFTLERILAEYQRLCKQHRVKPDPAFLPQRHEERGETWIYPIWEKVIDGIRESNPACIDLGIWCLETPEPIMFGRSIRSSIVRELGRAKLKTIQADRLRKLIPRLLMSRHPHVHYKRLTRLFLLLEPERRMFEPFQEPQEDPYIEARRLAVLERAEQWFRERGEG